MLTTEDALPLFGDRLWSFTDLSYAFPRSVEDFPENYGLLSELDGFAPMSLAAIPVFDDAFSRYAEVSGLTFTRVDDNAVMDIGTSTSGSVAWAYFPGQIQASGDIWINTAENDVFDPLVSPPSAYHGDYIFTTLLHEIGHAVGLLHGHDVLPSDLDATQFTVMTYRSFVGDPVAGVYSNREGSFPQSLMVLDIAAIQAAYGVNWDTASGDTTYHFNPDNGQILRDEVVINDPIENIIFTTLWDGGGIDTLDFSDYVTGLVIDLTPGAGSNLDAFGIHQRASLSPEVDAPHHLYLAIAPEGDARALFENAIGGTGADSFVGNAADNAFRGGLGTDRYTGNGGADQALGTVDELDGDRFADFGDTDEIVIEGYSGGVEAVVSGSGLDLNFSAATLLLEGDYEDATFRVNLADENTSISLAGLGATRLTDAGERFITTDGGSNEVFADAGDDVIVTSEGDDILLGGDGFDVLLGGAGQDLLIGGAQGDRLTGGEGGDRFTFSINEFDATTADFVTDFEIGIDVIELAGFGYTSFDDLSFLSVAAGDALQLDEGFIILEGIASGDLAADDFLFSEAAIASSLISVAPTHSLTEAGDRFVTSDAAANEVFAGGGDDVAIAGDGANVLFGGVGNDVLNGGADADRLIGGQGADRMIGRGGADIFEFTAGEETGFAADFIADFEAADTVLLQGFGLASFADLTFSTAASGDVALELATTHFVIFEGVTDTNDLASAFDFA